MLINLTVEANLITTHVRYIFKQELHTFVFPFFFFFFGEKEGGQLKSSLVIIFGEAVKKICVHS